MPRLLFLALLLLAGCASVASAGGALPLPSPAAARQSFVYPANLNSDRVDAHGSLTSRRTLPAGLDPSDVVFVTP